MDGRSLRCASAPYKRIAERTSSDLHKQIRWGLRTHTNERTQAHPLRTRQKGKIAYFAKTPLHSGEAHKKRPAVELGGWWDGGRLQEKFHFIKFGLFSSPLFPIRPRIFAMAAAEKGLEKRRIRSFCSTVGGECGRTVCVCKCRLAFVCSTIGLVSIQTMHHDAFIGDFILPSIFPRTLGVFGFRDCIMKMKSRSIDVETNALSIVTIRAADCCLLCGDYSTIRTFKLEATLKAWTCELQYFW